MSQAEGEEARFESEHQARLGEAARLLLEETSQKDPVRRAELRERRLGLEAVTRALFEQRVAVLLERDRIARMLAMEDVINRAPWIRSVRGADRTDLRPNGCSTCANAPARFTDEGLRASNEFGEPHQVRRDIQAKFPRYIDEQRPLRVHVVSKEDITRAAPGAGAYATYAGDIYIPADASLRTVTHEVLHALTAPGWSRRVPTTVNEAVTEFMTRRLGRFPPEGTLLNAKAYEGGQRLISDYVAANPAREDALAKAYLTGDFGDLDRLEDASMRGAPFSLRSPSAQRFRDWDARLRNVLPGSSELVDDEVLSPPPPAVPLPVEPGRAY